MPKWTDYTIKTDPADKDELMILDTIGKVNKRLGMSALSDFITNKVTGKKFDNLSTTGKTILGAINEVDGNEKQLKQRVDNISNLPDGSTTADAELVDIRVGADGVAYSSAGEAVREQFKGNDEKINSLKEDVSTKITKFYASNQGETHLADSDNGKIMDMMVYGKSEQKQYSGKNLLNYDAWKDTPIIRGTAIYENNGITLTATGNDCYSEMGMNFPDNAKIKVSEGETLTLSWEKIENKEGYIYIFGNGIANAGVSIDNRKSKKLSYTVPSGVTFITFRFGVTNAGDTISYKNIQIEKGSEITSYEPYTGGIPSPNPSYPQEIKSVVNPTVKVRGKNLLKPTLETTTLNGITCTANGDGTYTLNGTAIQNAFFPLRNDNALQNEKRYKITGCPSGSDGEIYMLRPRLNDGSIRDTGNGAIFIYLSEEKDDFIFAIRINEGFTCNNLLFKPMIVDADKYPDTTYDDFEPYHEQTVTLPYDLYGVKVTSGGNVTIDGQQYVSDYFDVERGKLVRMVADNRLLSAYNWNTANEYYWGSVPATTNGKAPITADNSKKMCACNYLFASSTYDVMAKKSGIAINNIKQVVIGLNDFASVDELKTFLTNNDVRLVYPLEVPEEIDLTSEEVQALKALATYYPTTNISVNSEQLDGYTVFNYPISMANGWNYVKKQLNDNRDYIYDMDTQAAEAYVNSEYAVALTELEV